MTAGLPLVIRSCADYRVLMAVLMRPDGTCTSLGYRTLVGRASYCAIVIVDPRVSAEHASIYFDKGGWYLRDLASTNGTYLDGTRIDLGRKHLMAPGAQVGFGSPNPVYRFVHDEPPRMRLRNMTSGDLVEPQLGLVVLPCEERPIATLFQGLDGWYEEHEGVVRQVADFAQLVVEGQVWVVELPPPGTEMDQTGLARSGGWATFDDLFLRFDVSRDRESIVLTIAAGTESRAVTNRAYHELLLVLAEARMDAIARALPELEQGWLHTDELCRRIAGDVSKVNVDVFRARQQFDQLGIIESHRIVERRPVTRHLRIGTPAIAINYEGESRASSKPPEPDRP